MGLARIANAQLFYNRYKNRDRDEKEGQPNSVDLLIMLYFQIGAEEMT